MRIIENTTTITDTIMMVRPQNFGPNPDTLADNSFQSEAKKGDVADIKAAAIAEFDAMVDLLRTHDIEVIVIEDTADPQKPDCIFPNNWFTTHQNGSIITYPMKALSRRLERREDIVDDLTERYSYNKRYGFEYHEEEESYLEGTGSMILDRVNRIVYAALSDRTHIKVLEKFCVLLEYDKVIFHSADAQGDAIYHTNVLMALGSEYAVICLDSIPDPIERKEVVATLTRTGKEIIEITMDQMNAFAGNMLQVKSKLGQRLMVMSKTAYQSLTAQQIDRILAYNKLIIPDIPTIEKYGGGSVRCMMAEVYGVG